MARSKWPESDESVWSQFGDILRYTPENPEPSGDTPQWQLVLEAFGRRPFAFILGVVLETLLGGLSLMLTALLDAIRTVFVGDSTATTAGRLGLADIPLFIAETLIMAGEPIGTAVLTVAGYPAMLAVDLASQAGLFALPIIAATAGGYIIALAIFYRLAVEAGADLVPGLGGVIQ